MAEFLAQNNPKEPLLNNRRQLINRIPWICGNRGLYPNRCRHCRLAYSAWPNSWPKTIRRNHCSTIVDSLSIVYPGSAGIAASILIAVGIVVWLTVHGRILGPKQSEGTIAQQSSTAYQSYTLDLRESRPLS